MSYDNMEKLASVSNEAYGTGVFVRGNEYPNFRVTPTGIFTLDLALCGGIAEGGVIIAVGHSQAGKTTQSLRIIGNGLRKYEEDESSVAVVCDYEGTFDPVWAKQLGVPTDRLWVANPEIGEAGVDVMIAAIKQPEVKYLLLDSVPMLVSEDESKKSAFDDTMTENARLMKKFLNAANVEQIKRRRMGDPVTIILINSYRDKIGGFQRFPTYTMPGGKLQGLLASTIIEFKFAGESDSAGSEQDLKKITESNEHDFKLKKFKGPKNIESGTFTMIRNPNNELGSGQIDDYLEAIRYAKKYKLIRGSGQNWRIHGVESTFKNMDDMRKFFIDDNLEYLDLKAKIIGIRRHRYGLPMLPPDNFLMRHHGEGLGLDDLLANIEVSNDNDSTDSEE